MHSQSRPSLAMPPVDTSRNIDLSCHSLQTSPTRSPSTSNAGRKGSAVPFQLAAHIRKPAPSSHMQPPPACRTAVRSPATSAPLLRWWHDTRAAECCWSLSPVGHSLATHQHIYTAYCSHAIWSERRTAVAAASAPGVFVPEREGDDGSCRSTH